MSVHIQIYIYIHMYICVHVYIYMNILYIYNIYLYYIFILYIQFVCALECNLFSRLVHVANFHCSKIPQDDVKAHGATSAAAARCRPDLPKTHRLSSLVGLPCGFLCRYTVDRIVPVHYMSANIHRIICPILKPISNPSIGWGFLVAKLDSRTVGETLREKRVDHEATNN